MAGVNRITGTDNMASVIRDISGMVGSQTFDQGDLLFLDTSAHLVKRLATEATDSATFLGISQCSIVNGKVADPIQGTAVDAAQGVPALPGPVHGVIAKLVAHTGSAFPQGCLVYADPVAGPFHVAATGTNPIGVYQGTSNISSATAGQLIEVKLGAVVNGQLIGI